MKLDVLAIAAHPDDAEICAGGTLLLFQRAGKKIGVIDLTRGEMGTRGTAEDRDAETQAASRALGLSVRENLRLPDGRVVPTVETRERLAALLREHAPELVLAHSTDDLHPDHAAAGTLALQAWYLSGLTRLAPENTRAPARRPRRLLHFMGHVPFDPTFVVDITAVWDAKCEAVRAYGSQLRPANAADQGEHFLFGADVLERMETRARYFGERIGVRYGEPLLSRGILSIGDVTRLV
ncbi:MAG TPA: bacillithiol biosynthesis deacetylase BshB1 [Planctomycetota bacterium]|nr:bacillithiol biosynthesis deacetylase BshB1 [Planctomycetota bacterium]